MKTTYSKITPFVTKDASLIRELIHPSQHGPTTMSFAEATVDVGGTTRMHLHRESEEIYHITQGIGTMRLGGAEFEIHVGDTIHIAPGTAHNVTSTGAGALKIICVSCPPYLDEDTALV